MLKLLCIAIIRKDETIVRVFRNRITGALQETCAFLVVTLEIRTSVGGGGGTSYKHYSYKCTLQHLE